MRQSPKKTYMKLHEDILVLTLVMICISGHEDGRLYSYLTCVCNHVPNLISFSYYKEPLGIQNN